MQYAYKAVISCTSFNGFWQILEWATDRKFW